MTLHVTAGNPQPVAHPCPNCGSKLTQRISDFERCSQCGRQFNQTKIATAPAKARAELEELQSQGRMALNVTPSAEHVQEPGIRIEQEALADKKARRQNEPS